MQGSREGSKLYTDYDIHSILPTVDEYRVREQQLSVCVYYLGCLECYQ